MPFGPGKAQSLPHWYTTCCVWGHESSLGMHVSPAPSPLGKTDVDPRASVTQANWIWPAAGALTAHFGGGREGGQKRRKPAFSLLLVWRSQDRAAALPGDLSLVGGRDIRTQGQCPGALLELFVLLLHPSGLCTSCVCCFVPPPCVF